MWLVLSKSTSSPEMSGFLMQNNRLARFEDIFVGQRTFMSLIIKPAKKVLFLSFSFFFSSSSSVDRLKESRCLLLSSLPICLFSLERRSGCFCTAGSRSDPKSPRGLSHISLQPLHILLLSCRAITHHAPPSSTSNQRRREAGAATRPKCVSDLMLCQGLRSMPIYLTVIHDHGSGMASPLHLWSSVSSHNDDRD